MQFHDFDNILNSIHDSQLKLVFKKVVKHNTSVVENGMKELINLLPNLDYNTLFIEIVGHCCLVFDHFLFNEEKSLRILSLSMIGKVITRLKKDIVGYATLIFPTLLVYCNDQEVSVEASQILEVCFPNETKKIALLQRMNFEICQKISDIFDFMKNGFVTNNSFGRVTAACFSLIIELYQKTQGSNFINDLIAKINIKHVLQVENNKFLPYITPTLKLMSYKFLYTFNIQDMKNNFLYYMTLDDSKISQDELISIILLLMDNNQISKEDVKKSFLQSVHLYVNPSNNVLKLLQSIGDDDYYFELIQNIKNYDSQKLFDLVFSLIKNKEILLPIFEEIISFKYDDTSGNTLLNTCPIEIFEFFKDNTKLGKILKNGDESKCISFLPFLNQQQVIQWLQERGEISINCAYYISKTFSSNIIRNIWPTLSTIPDFDDEEHFIDFLALYLSHEEIPEFIKKHENKLIELLKKWTRDYSILECKQLLDYALPFIENDINMIKYFDKIFPGNEEISDILAAVILNSVQNGEEIDASIFDYFTPSNEFLKDFLFSKNLSMLKSNHPLIKPLIDAIPAFISKYEYSVLEGPVVSFVKNCKLDPLSIKFDYTKYPLFAEKYFSQIGYDVLQPEIFCQFLESYLKTKIPWLHVFLYLRNIDWQMISNSLWSYASEIPEYASICHSMNLPLALSCICAASDINIDTLPKDSLTYYSNSNTPPDTGCISSELMDIIKMEWNQIVPKSPDFSSNDNIQLKLRQTAVYLSYFLPTLNDFGPVFNLLFNAFDKCDDRLSFFLCTRIIIIINQTKAEIPSSQLLDKMISFVKKFSPLTTAIENEIIEAFSIAKRLNLEEFNQIISKWAPLLSTSFVTQLSRLILPLFQYFNAWDLLKDNINNQLDLSNILSWTFITNALIEMPLGVRTDFIRKYSKKVTNLLDSLLDQKNFNPKSYEQLITAFPVTFSKWVCLDKNKLSQANTILKQKVTKNIFKSIVKDIIRMKLDSTVVHNNVNSLSITITYKEDDLSAPIKLNIKFPENYPIETPRIETDIGDVQLSRVCDQRIQESILLTESIENGVKTWYEFVIQRVKDADPCPICYSYINSVTRQSPSIKCSVCGQMFHPYCLKKWFERCLYHTCPVCATKWRAA